jgi:hypothetical protein
VSARWAVLLALAGALGARACEQVERRTEFLGWTADGAQFAWSVEERVACGGCKDPEGDMHVYVTSLVSERQEFLTRWKHEG